MQMEFKKRTLLARMHLSRWRGRAAWAAGILLGLMIVLWTLARMAPPWYQPLDPRDQGVIDTAGQAEHLIHFDLRNAVERVPLGEQTWTISQDEINSYLAIDLGPTFEAGSNGKVPAVSDPYVVFLPGEVRVSVRTTKIPGGGKAGAIGTLAFSFGIVKGEDGSPEGLVKLTGAWVGRLRVPTSLVASRIEAVTPALIEAVQQAIELRLGAADVRQWEPAAEEVIHDAATGKPFPLHYRLDRKNLVITALDMGEGRFTLKLSPPPRTLPLAGPALMPGTP
jgi:hypothetical protein